MQMVGFDILGWFGGLVFILSLGFFLGYVISKIPVS